MQKRSQKRHLRIGCIVTPLLAIASVVWLFLATNQVPTAKFAFQRALLVLQGPLNPDDKGVKELWEHTLASLQREIGQAFKVLRWLGMPREVTVVFYQAETSPLGVVAINFPRGYRLLWLLFRIFGKHYKGAHYFADFSGSALGMSKGTVILADDEATFCLAIDNLLRSEREQRFNLHSPRRLRDRYDFVGVMKPHFLLPPKHGSSPSDLAEVGIDIVSADELKGEILWVCQSEREAEAVMKALEWVEKGLAEELSRKGGHCSFRKWHEGMFVWWKFRLTGTMPFEF